MGNGTAAARWLLVALALLPFAAVRHYPHVHDDHLLRGPGSVAMETSVDWGTLLTADFFGTAQRPTGHTAFWRPLVLASFRMEALLTGGDPAALAWLGHVLTMLCHAGATLALWALLRALGLSPGTALVAAALFAVHPVHVESVAWASGRTDSLPTLLAWGGLALWLGRPDRARPGLWAGALFLAALLAKEPAVVLVACAPLLARARGLSWAAASAPAVAALLVALVLRATLFGLAPSVDGSGFMGPDSPAERWFTWASILPDLVGLTLWPGPYSPVHPVAAATSWDAPGVVAGLAVLTLVLWGAGLAWTRRWLPGLFAGSLVGLTLLALAPWARFPTGYAEVAGPLYERYVYAMAAAPCVLLAWAGRQLWIRRPLVAPLLAVVLGLALGPVTAARTRAWSSDEAFARAGLAAIPHSADMWTHLGSAQLESLRIHGDRAAGDAALVSFRQALERDPGHRIAALNRFITLALMNAEERASDAAGELLRRWPDDAPVLDNVAGWHASRGRYREALALYERELAGPGALPGALPAARACRAALGLSEG